MGRQVIYGYLTTACSGSIPVSEHEGLWFKCTFIWWEFYSRKTIIPGHILNVISGPVVTKLEFGITGLDSGCCIELHLAVSHPVY